MSMLQFEHKEKLGGLDLELLPLDLTRNTKQFESPWDQRNKKTMKN